MDQRVDQQRYNSGEVILFPGPAHHLYLVREGLVRVHMVDDEGNGLTLRYVKPGGYFGEESLLGSARRYFAEAMTDTVLDVRQDGALDELERQAVTEHLADALAQLYQSLHRVSGKRLKARVAAELLELCDSALAEPSTSGPVIRITHDDLAAAVGSVRETVTKMIGELGREGALEAGYGRIVLTDLPLLEVIAGE